MSHYLLLELGLQRGIRGESDAMRPWNWWEFIIQGLIVT